MIRSFASFPIADFQQTKLQMLNWANRFNIFCFLDNNHYNFSPGSFECLLAAGSVRSIKANAGNALEQLNKFCTENKDWIFGHLGYDLKNEIEKLASSLFDGLQFPDLFFFIPEIVVELNKNELRVGAPGNNHKKVFDEIVLAENKFSIATNKPVNIKNRISKKDYVSILQQLKQHILRGDCYEINFCQEFYVDEIFISPSETYQVLSKTSPNPFSAFYKLDDKYLLCASPERYLKKTGDIILSQPIKGTHHRNLESITEDEKNKVELFRSAKERSENVMIVDLVRNDLSKICEEGSVKVDELFGIYSFPQVHQMISTVIGRIKKDVGFTDIIKSTFPMGSMTGAPKKKVMELIENYEKTKRGLFSGAIGYITPNGDFDFNVVIRSMLYNSSNRYLSFHTGSAITFYSDPEKEYEECLLKAAAIKKVLAANQYL